MKRKWGWLLLVVFLVVSSVDWAAATSEEFSQIDTFAGYNADAPWTIYDLVAFSTDDNETTQIWQDGARIDDGQIAGGPLKGAIARDRSSAVLLTDQNALYFIIGHEILWVDSDVRNYDLALDGGAVAFCTSDGALKVYNPSKGTVIICEDFDDCWDTVGDVDGYAYAISPDGVVVYTRHSELKYYADGVCVEATGTSMNHIGILSIGRHADTVYLTGWGSNGRGYFVAKRGEISELSIPGAEDIYPFEQDTADDGSALIVCVEMEGSDGHRTCVSVDGGDFRELPFKEGIRIANRVEAHRYQDRYLPLDNYANCVVIVDEMIDGEERWSLGLLDSDMNLRREGPFYIEGYLFNCVMTDGEIYAKRAEDGQWSYSATALDAPVLLEDKRLESAYLSYYPGCDTAYFRIPDNGIMPVKGGHVGEMFEGTQIGCVTAQAVYYYADIDSTGNYELRRRTHDGQVQTLVPGLYSRFENRADVLNFVSPLLNGIMA